MKKATGVILGIIHNSYTILEELLNIIILSAKADLLE